VASRTEIPTIVEQSTVKYLDALDEELSQLPGYSRPVPTEKEKIELKSNADMDCGYIHQERKKGLGYLAEMTADTKHGIITGVDCYPANRSADSKPTNTIQDEICCGFGILNIRVAIDLCHKNHGSCGYETRNIICYR
jgi:hypothetical protein